MNPDQISVSKETPADFDAIEAMTELAFGPGRFARTAFRLREGNLHDPDLSFAAKVGGELVGSVRLTQIRIGKHDALLLGPLVVTPSYKNTGIGAALMRTAVEAARDQGHGLLILVGDEPYYGRFGFEKVPAGQIKLPGPADPDRILACSLVADALATYRGVAAP